MESESTLYMCRVMLGRDKFIKHRSLSDLWFSLSDHRVIHEVVQDDTIYKSTIPKRI